MRGAAPAAILGALRRALPILFTARIVSLAFLPLLIAAVVWIVIAVAAWTPLTDALAHAFGERTGDASWLARIAAQLVAIVMFAALAVATALTAIAVLAMPVIVRTVSTRHFPALAEQRGGSLLGSAKNAALALLVFVPLWLASLALLVFPPLYAVASLLLNAWLSQRMFRYDALAEHASAAEIATVLRREPRTAAGPRTRPVAAVPRAAGQRARAADLRRHRVHRIVPRRACGVARVRGCAQLTRGGRDEG